MNNILFIGGGNMTRAIVTGLVVSGYDAKCLYVLDRNEAKRQFFSQTHKIKVTEHIEEFLPHAEIIFLAIKPQGAKETCAVIKRHLTQKPLIISVMSGITLANLGLWLGTDLAIVRTMPNTPALIQAGATGLFANAHTSEEQKQQTEKILKAIGITAWLKAEEDLSTITALSGSGPAYYFYFMEIMTDVAVAMGIDKELARRFATQTALGAAKLAMESDDDLAALRSQVTSKGGTTAEAIKVMQQQNLPDILKEAMNAARKRSIEFSQTIT